MDDFLLIHHDANFLMECQAKIAQMLMRLDCQFNTKKTGTYPLSDGILFLGFHYRLTQTGKVIMTLNSANIKHERKKLRKLAPDLLTSVSTLEVAPLVFRTKLHCLPDHFDRKIIFQVPVQMYGVKIVTERFIREMHKRDAVIMVWTINDEKEMERLYSMGVDTIMTDDPALLIKTAERLGLR